jgi:hypothetical protein
MRLNIKKEFFIDEHGRSVLLRGVNLGGSSKVPSKPNGATHLKTDFNDHRDVSFVGRPFPIKEANEHLNRIKHWGFNCLRFLITWEAIEHKGPKKYDLEYLDYIEEILKIAESHKLYFFIDPHQDVWSRMSGGCGAPGWIFEKVGLDFTKFDKTEAAFVMQYRYDPSNPKAYPDMYWDGNNVRFANATIWTLFFGAKDFAPSCKINGLNAQEYLQQHYFDAIKQVALRVKDNSFAIGFDTLNEPKQGWIEVKVDGSGKEEFSEVLGHDFKPIDAMALAASCPRQINYREIKGVWVKITRRDLLNKEKVSCWFKDVDDIWQKEGIWKLDDAGEQPIILKNDHFVYVDGKKVDFYRDYLTPFILNFSKNIRTVMPEAIIFFEGPEVSMMRGQESNFEFPDNIGSFVHAPHWYDIASTATKKAWLRFSLDVMTNKFIIGKKNVQKMYLRHLSKIKEVTKNITGGIPTIIGEFGLHYDLYHKKAYKKFKKVGDKAFKKNVEALSMYYNALDENLLSGTQWNYTADNCNDWGDLWNLEDLSIFSRDQQLDPNDINSGGRAIEGFCRPHFLYCSGIPLKMEFNLKRGSFYFEFEGDSNIKAPTIIYVPKIQYPFGYDLDLSDGVIEHKEDKQLVYLNINKDGIHTIKINRIK